MAARQVVIDWALRYAALGWKVLPCIGKNPNISGDNWQDRATNDPVRIQRWFGRLPAHVNIGFLTGHNSWVLDIDAKSGGLESLEEIEAKYGKLPDTLQALTGGGGRHYHFLVPADFVPHSIPQSRMWPGVEVKAHNSFVVCHPSIHPDSGKPYEWDGLAEIENTPVLPAPEWLLQIVRQGGVQARGAAGAALASREVPSVIRVGEQHNELVSVAGALRRKGLGIKEMFAALRAMADERCEVPASDDYILARCGSVMKYAPEKAMHGVKEINRQYESERIREVAKQSKAGPMEADPQYRAQGGRLELSPTTGKPERHLFNATQALTYAPHWCNKLAYNEFTMRIVAAEDLCDGLIPAGRELSDYEMSLIRLHMQGMDNIHVSKEETVDAVRIVAGRNSSHPVRNWMSGLAWDRAERVDSWLIDFLGVVDTPYARAVGRKWLVGTVARIFEPGCQMDVCLILEGGQGVGKSSALRTLAGREWFSDTLGDIASKDTPLSFRGKWIIEIQEIDRIFIKESSEVKEFVSKRSDLYRPPYAREAVDVKRESAFSGTTNQDNYFKDETGARRFWPVVVGEIDLAGIAQWREQLIAEAVWLYSEGERPFIPRSEADVYFAALAEQRRRYEGDPWTLTVLDYAHNMAGKPLVAEDIITGQLNKKIADVTRQDSNRVGKILRAEGYVRRQFRRNGRPVWGFFPGNTLDLQDLPDGTRLVTG